MPLRSVKMNRFIFGFHRRVWCPKWTPLSSSCFMLTTAMVAALLRCARPAGPRFSVDAEHRVAPALAFRSATPPAVARRDRGGDCPPEQAGGERAKSIRPETDRARQHTPRGGAAFPSPVRRPQPVLGAGSEHPRPPRLLPCSAPSSPP